MTDANGERLDLAGALCARVCHDLAGSLGALSGMLELLEGVPDPEALGVARDCARELTDRLRLFRAAWTVDGEVGAWAPLLAGLPGGARLMVDLDGLGPMELAMRRVTLCALIVAAGGLPQGGTIVATGGVRLRLRLAGVRAGWPAAVTGAADARGVAMAMARLQAARLGLVVTQPDGLCLEVG